MLTIFGNDKAKEYLLSFSCPLDRDIESFLHLKSIRFEQADAARTYLVLGTEGFILAYFSLTFKELPTNNFALSKTRIKKINGISKNATSLKVYLIGQIAKNFSLHENPITLNDILSSINIIIEKAQELIGGRVTILECQNNSKIISLYEKHGFEKLPIKGEEKALVTMLFNN
ncbi:GNAT family N-acetyltransferase [Xenorhabdus sp. Reich]|uniref:GNAT family N-acetyltransferase n=1 Tax=Xenorhabdus littoralis TaxID=2582835 RepID=A0ABU4SKG9_9GAMM|nr:acetyltransferase [Xenorhabdus sp. Reich]MDX7999141.1 GNAT family N-acetyltransferase [Xenorhabdus sp. Reich]